ncbi:energy-coupling factor ABC transporter ATP-binding protein [Thermoproteota archaeon]
MSTKRTIIPTDLMIDNSNEISINNFGFTYFNSKEPALKNINIKIKPGEIVLIAGPSGCGKSTLLKSINGLIPHMYPGNILGNVSIDNIDVAQTSITEIAKKVGFVFQNPENQIFMFSVERDIAFGLENLGMPREVIREQVDWAIHLLGIENLATRAPHELSDGQKQRVALAGVLAMKPGILVLDEPTSLLDPYAALELVEIVKMLNKDLGVTVLIVEHRLDIIVKVANRIICLSKGEVLHDDVPRKVLSKKKLSDIGIGVPIVSNLHNILNDNQLELGETSLSTEELVNKLDVILS